MGAAVSTPAGLDAFRIAQAEHGRLHGGYYSDVFDLADIPQEELSRRVHDVFVRALAHDAGLTQLILARWIAQTVEEQGAYLESFLGAVLAQDKKLRPKAAVADYSKSFSGSAADTKAEKDAAALMRNDGGGAAHEDDERKDVGDPLLCPPKLGRDARDLNGKSLDRILLRRSAPWLRFMSASDCVLYVHVLTKEIVSVRPDEYDESSDIPSRGACTKAQTGSPASADEADVARGLPTCTAATLLATIDDIIAAGETPLILDPHNEQAVRTFFQYKGRLADISSMTVPFAKSGMKLTDHAERCRATLVGAIKSGSTFALYLGDLTQEHAELKKKFFKREVFPAEIFQKGGLKLLDTYQGKPRFESIFREEDLEQGQAIAREGYRAVIITTLSPGEHAAKLTDCIPLGYCKAIYFTK